MIRLVASLYRLGNLPAYRHRVAGELPEIARFDPGHDAVMMGYDFHVTPQGPRLIEVNTNAGGALFAIQSEDADKESSTDFPLKAARKLADTFREEYGRFSAGVIERAPRIAIVDERPEEQFLYEEMQAFARLLSGGGGSCVVCDPTVLSAGEDGAFYRGERIDLIYNRHCDFYLESSPLAGIRSAYLARKICLTPNPFVYGLLADKRRMILWSDPGELAALPISEGEADLIQKLVPKSRLLANLESEQVWKERKKWVFKPVDRFASQGVLVGEKMTRTRFGELDPTRTLVQEHVPPSFVAGPDDASHFKADYRLFAYRGRILGLAARLYRGQVTNLRTPGGGFAAIKIV